MRRKPKQQRSEKMLQLILEGALDAVARYGMEGTTTRHIAERAGISVGTLYHYFDDKADVYTALQDRMSSQLVTTIRALIPNLVQKDIGTAVADVLHLFLAELDRDGGKQLAFIRNILHRSFDRDVGRIEQVMMELTLMYAAHHPEFATIKNLPRVMYILFNAVTFNIIRHLDSPSPHVNSEQLIEGVSQMCVAYINSQMPAES
jgi:AcrR family transcriptional regulator